MQKRIITIIAIFIIITGTFFQGYFYKYPVYASSWESCDTLADQVEAFKAYCKSRDLTIEGSALDQITSFTTKSYQNALNALGLNMNQIQAEIKKSTDGNTGVKFLFTATGANLFNRIFSQFLQDNDLAVGDIANQQNNTVYSGYYYGGNYVYIVDVTTTPATIVQEGTAIAGLDGYALYDEAPKTYTFNPFNLGNYSFTTEKEVSTTWRQVDIGSRHLLRIHLKNGADDYLQSYGRVCFYAYEGAYDTLYFGVLGQSWGSSGTLSSTWYTQFQTLSNANVQNVNVFLTTNNNTINNNTYNNNTYTIINNEGDVYNYGDNDEPSPDLPTPDPDTPDPPAPDVPDGDGWDDFTLPEMPNDWLIYGMEKKFPFDIPFNIMFALSLLNHEPVTPRFTGDIDLKVCTWHYDIDLTPFDDIAKILRKFEVLAFIIGLAMITKELIMWG